ncbi:Autophagy-related protein [Lachnellula suecica]|uniref:Autophagy-related protein n=1 Tax=Lachnellula suecica TaxID=602035 RepID=A0A8T9CD50_9HELO|nr:Autophagy-related protein [Lachnellula suecica]
MANSVGTSSQIDAVSKHLTAVTADAEREEAKAKHIEQNLQKYQQLFEADEDAFNQPTTTRKELWSYYLYYNGSGTKSVASVVLIANGICFAVMTVMFVSVGSAADYGNFGRWLLLTLTCGTLVFYAALFPRLARYMPHVRKAREEDLKDGKISQPEYGKIESLERNHISSVSTAHSNIGYLLTLAIKLSVLLPLQVNPFSNNLALCLTNTWKQVALTLREVRHLPQTFTYLAAFFLLADGLNTTGSLVSIIQNGIVSFSFLQITYLGLAQAACSITSTFRFRYIQKNFNIKTKTMFNLTNFFSVFIPFYGILGLCTKTVGYHHVRDFWIYNFLFGLFQAPYDAYSQTMMSEVTPKGYKNMFFGLFGVTNGASSIIGPNAVQAIINSTNNNWTGFPFLFALCFAANVVIWFVDIEKGRDNCRKYVEERKLVRVARESGLTTDEVIDGVASGELVPEASSSSSGHRGVENVRVQPSKKGHVN